MSAALRFVLVSVIAAGCASVGDGRGRPAPRVDSGTWEDGMVDGGGDVDGGGGIDGGGDVDGGSDVDAGGGMDAGMADAGFDAGMMMRDAGRDAGPPDAGPPPGCRSAAECSNG